MIAHTAYDVAYLPIPNRIEIVLSDQECDPRLTRTSFVVPVTDYGSIVLCEHARRGTEIAGGHIEPGETMRQGAAREGVEETGCTVGELVPIGFLRMICDGPKPEVWDYPFPVSYQQFYAGRVLSMAEFEPNEECNRPRVTKSLEGFARPSIKIFGEAALAVIKGQS